MKVTLGEKGLTKTWQSDFPKWVECVHCKGESRIAFVAHEGLEENFHGAFICNLHPNGGKGDFWVHDCCAVAVYFCKDCLKATALMNQG